jgi:hypothetical protein
LKLRNSSFIPFHFAIPLGFSYSHAALAVHVLVLEETPASRCTSTISLSARRGEPKVRNFKNLNAGSLDAEWFYAEWLYHSV